MSITIEELRHEICGKKTESNKKCLVSITTQKINPQNPDEEPVTISEKSTVNAVVEMYPNGNFTVVDLIFPNEKDGNLISFFKILESYLKSAEKSTETSEYLNFFSFVPLGLGGSAFVQGLYPVFWALEPEQIGGELKTLRVIFLSDNVLFLESDMTQEDLDLFAAQSFEEEQKKAEAETEENNNN